MTYNSNGALLAFIHFIAFIFIDITLSNHLIPIDGRMMTLAHESKTKSGNIFYHSDKIIIWCKLINLSTSNVIAIF